MRSLRDKTISKTSLRIVRTVWSSATTSGTTISTTTLAISITAVLIELTISTRATSRVGAIEVVTSVTMVDARSKQIRLDLNQYDMDHWNLLMLRTSVPTEVLRVETVVCKLETAEVSFLTMGTSPLTRGRTSPTSGRPLRVEVICFLTIEVTPLTTGRSPPTTGRLSTVETTLTGVERT